MKIPSTNPMDLELKLPTRFMRSLARYLTRDKKIENRQSIIMELSGF
ncbi:MAG TPA: hypothetical protein VK250_00700 [Nitrososphaeraceae archaeon]|nr:hypothetical protein [Nitrososphaeraceae archaeon]